MSCRWYLYHRALVVSWFLVIGTQLRTLRVNPLSNVQRFNVMYLALSVGTGVRIRNAITWRPIGQLEVSFIYVNAFYAVHATLEEP